MGHKYTSGVFMWEEIHTSVVFIPNKAEIIEIKK
jgi:hypothetical protein